MNAGWQVAFASVSKREVGDPKTISDLVTHTSIPEALTLNESPWDVARWPDADTAARLQQILTVICNGKFAVDVDTATRGELHQLRDALILEAHAAARREVFVTDDQKAFLKHGRRERLEALLTTRILTTAEFEQELTTK